MTDNFYNPKHAFGSFDVRVLKPGAMIEAHRHGHVEANMLRHASMVYQMEDRTITLPSNTLAIFWAGQPHRVLDVLPDGIGTPELCNIYMPLDWLLMLPRLQQMKVDLLAGDMLDLGGDDHLWRQLLKWQGDCNTNQQSLINCAQSEIAQLLRRKTLETYKKLGTHPHKLQKAKSNDAERRHAIIMVRHIIEHLDQDLSSISIAKIAGLSTNHAHSVFTRTIGLSMRQFTIRLRLQLAHSALNETDRSIARIANDCGFGSISLFYQHFKRLYGKTPQQARGIVL